MSQLHRILYANQTGSGKGIHKPGRWNPSSLLNQFLKKVAILQNNEKVIMRLKFGMLRTEAWFWTRDWCCR
jgi:hypothetical protein